MFQPIPRIETKNELNHNGKKSFIFKVIPERGAWIYFELDDSGKIWVKIDASKKLPYSIFVRLFEHASESDWLCFLKTVTMDTAYGTVQKAKERFEEMFSRRHYKLSERVRLQLNQIIYPETRFHNLHDILTKEDVLAIGNYLLKKKHEEKRAFTIKDILTDYTIENEMLSLQKEMDTLLQWLHLAKTKIEKDIIIERMKTNRSKYDYLNR